MGKKLNLSTHPRNCPFCFLWGSCANTPPTLPNSPVAKNHLHNHSPQRTWVAYVNFEKDVVKHLCVLLCGEWTYMNITSICIGIYITYYVSTYMIWFMSVFDTIMYRLCLHQLQTKWPNSPVLVYKGLLLTEIFWELRHLLSPWSLEHQISTKTLNVDAQD